MNHCFNSTNLSLLFADKIYKVRIFMCVALNLQWTAWSGPGVDPAPSQELVHIDLFPAGTIYLGQICFKFTQDVTAFSSAFCTSHRRPVYAWRSSISFISNCPEKSLSDLFFLTLSWCHVGGDTLPGPASRSYLCSRLCFPCWAVVGMSSASPRLWSLSAH